MGFDYKKTAEREVKSLTDTLNHLQNSMQNVGSILGQAKKDITPEQKKELESQIEDGLKGMDIEGMAGKVQGDMFDTLKDIMGK